MKTWTNQAEKRLAEYLEERVRREGFDGEEADELKSDLRRHIHEEAEKDLSDGIGSMQLENILGRLDSGYRSMPRTYEIPPVAKPRGKGMRSFWAWTWGVVMPAGVAVFEMLTGFCGSAFFDPVATGWHALLILLVPVINAWLLSGAPRGSERGKGFAVGLATVVAVFYALLFVPLLPYSVIAVIFIGMGFLSLTPVLAGIYTWRIGRLHRRGSPDVGRYRAGWKFGVAAAVAALLALEAPPLWTRANLGAAAGEGEGQQAAISRLRAFHSPRVMLRACYEGNRGSRMGGTDISGWIESGWRGGANLLSRASIATLNTEKTRDVFFRVTGKPFNSLKPPRGSDGGGLMGRRDRSTTEWEFDDHLGGDDVAVRLKNLDLSESRFDGHVDARSQTGYGEWTMVFHNRALNPQEARCQVLLPRGGRVSRLTLWVNGEPREAAFNSVSKVKAAYKEVAVVQRRDPVLVTQCGPDTVLVQCFPVPAGGDMKIRFGITAPLDDGLWEMPRVLERNFGVKDGLEHALWLQGDGAFELVEKGAEKRVAVPDGPGRSMTLALSPESVLGGTLAVRSTAATEPVVWCEDKFAPAFEKYLIRESKPVRRQPSKPLLVVIDGSASLGASKDGLAAALKDLPLRVIVANDHVVQSSPEKIAGHDFSGGRDNEPALREAVRRAKNGDCDEIVWIHGPQAVGLSQAEALLQMLERGTRMPVIHEVALVSGPNRLAEALHRSGALRRGPVLMDPPADLAAFMKRLCTERDETTWHWRRTATPPEGLGKPVWDHLARQWAIDAVDSPLSGIPEEDRPALAARYQLVTRVSGAVVLETMEQFEKHGLKPVDADSVPQVPGVPEPSTSLLLLVAAAAAACRRRR